MKTVTLLTVGLGLICISGAVEYKARYQPVDSIKLETYLNNPRLWAIQERCLLKNGPCDSIGRWIKARLYHGVATGKCLLCTPQQEKELTKLINYLIDERPQLYEEGVRKYLAENGISAPPVDIKSVVRSTTPSNQQSENES